jgi:hypothetical protein
LEVKTSSPRVRFVQSTTLSLLSVAGALIVFAALRAQRLQARDAAFGPVGLALFLIAIALAAFVWQARGRRTVAGATGPMLAMMWTPDEVARR